MMRNRAPDLFIERFNALLDEAGVGVDQLADEIRVDRSQVYRWRNGERSPEGSNLAAVADYFKVTMDWLWGRPGYPKAAIWDGTTERRRAVPESPRRPPRRVSREGQR